MFMYGFYDEKNPNKVRITFKVNLLEDDPMFDKKIDIIGKSPNWIFPINAFDQNEMIQLLSFLRIMLFDAEEAQLSQSTKKLAYYKENKQLPPISSRNEK